MPRCRKPVRIRLSTPDPIIVLFGCLPYPLTREKGEPCPTCHDLVKRESEKRLVICEFCGAVSRPLARLITAREVGRPESKRIEDERRKEREAAESLRSRRRCGMTEADVREIWFGCRTAFDLDIDVVNRAKVGQEWLASLGVEPDWTLILDKSGRVVGRVVPDGEDARAALSAAS